MGVGNVQKFIYGNGEPCPDGVCIVPDHHEQTFVVKTRSMNGIGVEAIKNLIQQKFEVVSIHATHCTTVARETISHDSSRRLP